MSKLSPWHRYAAHMLSGGYSPIPLYPNTKEPVARKRSVERPEPLVWRNKVNGWDRLRETPLTPEDIAKLSARYAQLGIAVAGGFAGLVPVDIDTDDPDVLAAYAAAMPRPNVAKKGRRGLVCFYRAAPGENIPGRDYMLSKAKGTRPTIDGVPGTPLVSVLVNRKTVLPPSVHPKTGKPYRWLNCAAPIVPVPASLYVKPRANLVPVYAANFDALAEALRPWCPPRPAPKYRDIQPGEIASDKRMRAYALGALQGYAKRLGTMTAQEGSGRNMQLFRAGCAMGRYVHHKVLAHGEVERTMMAAATACGLVRDDGEMQCRRSLASGIKQAGNDGLPALGFWGRSDGR